MEVSHSFSARPVIIPFTLASTVILLNLVLRDFDWRYNLTNASMSLAFSSIMTSALFGSLCAWWGSSLIGHLNASMQLSRRRISIVFTETFYLWLPVFACYLLAASAMLLTCATTYRLEFRPADLLPLLSAMVLIYALGVTGFVVGSRLRKFWVPPVLAIVFFGACLIAYTTSLAPLVQVGGATAPLVDVVPNWRFHLLGVFGWAVISVFVAHCFFPKASFRVAGFATLALVGLLTIIHVDSSHKDDDVDFRLAEVPVKQTCSPLTRGGELCLWSGYASFRSSLETDLSSVVEKFQRLGFSPAIAWGQSEKENDVLISPVASDVKDQAFWGLVNFYTPSSCDVVDFENYQVLADYELDDHPSEDQINKSRAALNSISQCDEK